ncbi:MAG TPA: nucleoside hydrolase-like domain-containing protein [Metabacillus sp.]|nr:nucleoside hydrolase-like domain-containing protein [Metabacillus sp.]
MTRDKKLRTVVMHDPELDDLNTIVRYLLYSNQFETEGLVYSSSRFHWKGDGKGTLFYGESEHSDLGIGPITSWRWDEGSRFIEDAVDIYAKVYQNLSVHAVGYPAPDELRSRIYEGNIEFPGDMSKDSPGSELIKRLLMDDEPGKLYLLTGAGHSTIGRALKSIEEEYKNTSQWKTIYEKVSKKTIIQSFGDQDGIYESYIGVNWPEIEFREMATTIWGYFARKVIQPEDRHYLSAAWTRENISKVGPFGEFYMVWGDGKQMHKNDIVDFFGFAGVTAEQLKELGYVPWYGGVEEVGSWISEGDTSMYMNLLDNGLDAHVEASYGGWGGRNGKDVDPNGVASKDYSSSRWFGAAQRDFAARMRWTVTSEYKDANHHPVVEVVGLESTTVKPGQTISLKAIARDPDGDHLTGHWWQYEEAGTYPGKVELLSIEEELNKKVELNYPFTVPAPGSPEMAKLIKAEIEVTSHFTVPSDAVTGQTLHLIFEVSDKGDIPLTTYKRVVLTVVR